MKKKYGNDIINDVVLLRLSAVYPTHVFAAVMSQTNFETLMPSMHFSDNLQVPPINYPGYNHLNKLKPFISLLYESFLNLYTPEQNVSVDESLMNFRGQLMFR